MRWIIYIFTLLILSMCLVSCRTQYIPVESVRTEYKTRDSIRTDSVYQCDSVFMLIKGDTVYQYKYKYLYKYQYLSKTDTVMKTDSVQVPYPVEKELNCWEKVKMELGGWAIGVIIVFAFIVVGRFVYKRRKK